MTFQIDLSYSQLSLIDYKSSSDVLDVEIQKFSKYCKKHTKIKIILKLMKLEYVEH